MLIWIFISIIGFGPVMIVTDRFEYRTIIDLSPQLVVASVKIGAMTGTHVSYSHWLWDSLVASVTLIAIVKLALSEDAGPRLRQDPFPE